MRTAQLCQGLARAHLLGEAVTPGHCLQRSADLGDTAMPGKPRADEPADTDSQAAPLRPFLHSFQAYGMLRQLSKPATF